MNEEIGKLSALTDAEYNPRKITKKQLRGLAASLREFGDLSGITFNDRTGNLICAHQRKKVILSLMPEAEFHWGPEYSTPRGLERDGWLIMADGTRFRGRRVNWSLSLEKAANLAANNPHISGKFTEDLDALLAELQADLPELFVEVNLDGLLPKLDDTFDIGAGDQSGELGDEFMVIVQCTSEEQQLRCIEELSEQGYVCKALIG